MAEQQQAEVPKQQERVRAPQAGELDTPSPELLLQRTAAAAYQQVRRHPRALAPATLLALQRTAGNAAVHRLLEQRTATAPRSGGPSSALGDARGEAPQNPGPTAAAIAAAGPRVVQRNGFEDLSEHPYGNMERNRAGKKGPWDVPTDETKMAFKIAQAAYKRKLAGGKKQESLITGAAKTNAGEQDKTLNGALLDKLLGGMPPAWAIFYDPTRKKYKIAVGQDHAALLAYGAARNAALAAGTVKHQDRGKGAFQVLAAGDLRLVGGRLRITNQTGTFSSNMSVDRLALTRGFFTRVLGPELAQRADLHGVNFLDKEVWLNPIPLLGPPPSSSSSSENPIGREPPSPAEGTQAGTGTEQVPLASAGMTTAAVPPEQQPPSVPADAGAVGAQPGQSAGAQEGLRQSGKRPRDAADQGEPPPAESDELPDVGATPVPPKEPRKDPE